MGGNCCTAGGNPQQRAGCPGCGQAGDAVSTTTLLHQLHRPWLRSPAAGSYYFCSSPKCHVVYFNEAGEHYSRSELRHEVGQKSEQPGRMLCYCFDIRYSDLDDEVTARQCRNFVINETRNKQCACEARNPSGRCCLRDFPPVKESTT